MVRVKIRIVFWRSSVCQTLSPADWRLSSICLPAVLSSSRANSCKIITAQIRVSSWLYTSYLQNIIFIVTSTNRFEICDRLLERSATVWIIFNNRFFLVIQRWLISERGKPLAGSRACSLKTFCLFLKNVSFMTTARFLRILKTISNHWLNRQVSTEIDRFVCIETFWTQFNVVITIYIENITCFGTNAPPQITDQCPFLLQTKQILYSICLSSSSCLDQSFNWIQFKLHVQSTSILRLFIVAIIQLENFIGDEFEKRTTEFVIPCLCQLALSSKESGLPKELNYQICLQTRSSKAKVRRESTPWSVHDCVILKDVYKKDVRRTIWLQLLGASHSLVRHQFHVHFHMHLCLGWTVTYTP